MSEVGTKLDLARAYMDMGDPDGARSILTEVLQEGSVSQKQEAQRLHRFDPRLIAPGPSVHDKVRRRSRVRRRRLFRLADSRPVPTPSRQSWRRHWRRSACASGVRHGRGPHRCRRAFARPGGAFRYRRRAQRACAGAGHQHLPAADHCSALGARRARALPRALFSGGAHLSLLHPQSPGAPGAGCGTRRLRPSSAGCWSP